MKLSCLVVESLLLDSRVGVSRMSMAQKFSFSRDVSCRIKVESRPLSRTTLGWPEGQDLGLSEGGDECSISQENSGKMNGDMNFTSSNSSLLG